MILLNSEKLPEDLDKYLAERQSQIDKEPDFSAKAKKANLSWSGKSKAKFEQIRNKLLATAIGVEVCNYCENNEGIDIEHIFPKSFFPARTFKWDNYLLACKKCNTHHKLDNFAVFNPEDSNIWEKLERKIEPPNEDAVMINPRTENGMDFLWLDITGKTFRFTPKERDNTKRAFIKAKFTIELLDLNRSPLVSARRNQAHNYVSDLERYVNVKNAQNFKELIAAVAPLNKNDVDVNQLFDPVKNKVLENLKQKIVDSPHTTVWEELKEQREKLKINRLFQQVPEALLW